MQHVKRKLQRPVTLLGLPGVGKSTVAAAFALRFGVEAVDIDTEIIRQTGKPIAALFAEQGEAAFRQTEHAAIATALEIDPPVLLAPGGGAFAQERTRTLLQQRSCTVWLHDTERAILSRLAQQPGLRPLLAGGDPAARLREIAAERTPVYRLAHIHLDLCEQNVDSAVETLYGLLNRHGVIIES